MRVAGRGEKVGERIVGRGWGGGGVGVDESGEWGEGVPDWHGNAIWRLAMAGDATGWWGPQRRVARHATVVWHDTSLDGFRPNAFRPHSFLVRASPLVPGQDA